MARLDILLGPQPQTDCCLIRPAVAKIRLKGNLVHVSTQKRPQKLCDFVLCGQGMGSSDTLLIFEKLNCPFSGHFMTSRNSNFNEKLKHVNTHILSAHDFTPF